MRGSGPTDPAPLKTICQVIPRLDEGGAERTTLEMAEAIVNHGWRAIIVTSGGRWVETAKQLGADIIIMPVHSKNPLTMARNRSRLIRLARQTGIDLFHARSRAPAWSALGAARALDIPFVTTYHGAYQARSRLKHYYNSVMVRGDAVIANSHFTAMRIRQTFPDTPDEVNHNNKAFDRPAPVGRKSLALVNRLHIIPRGVDLAVFDPARVSEDQIRTVSKGWTQRPDGSEAQTAPERPFRLLCPARLSGWKGHEIAIEAFIQVIKAQPQTSDDQASDDMTNSETINHTRTHLNTDTPRDIEIKALSSSPAHSSTINDAGFSRDMRLIFVGGANAMDQPGDETSSEGRLLRRLQDRVAVNGVQSKVYFAGHCNDMAAAYAWADAVLVPSTRPEAFGRVAVEAGAMGVPVIASNHGGLSETIIDSPEDRAAGRETGRLVAPGDASALAAAIIDLASTSETARSALGQRAQNHVRQTYSRTAMTTGTIDIYEQLLGSKNQDDPAFGSSLSASIAPASGETKGEPA